MNQLHYTDDNIIFINGSIYVNRRRICSREALMLSVLFDRVDILMYIDQYDDYVITKYKFLYEAFILAVQRGHLNVIKYFIEHDHIHNLQQALEIAEDHQNNEVIEYLQKEICA